MRLDVNSPDVFDRWRELYYELSHEENIAFGNAMEEKYPHQASYDRSAFLDYFLGLKAPVRVAEVGGWKGELAAALLGVSVVEENIASWHNIEMCRAAVDKTVPMPSGKYTAEFPSRFDWFCEPRAKPYDLFVSAHTIEHLTGKHLLALIGWLCGIPNVILEAPIGENGHSWSGYHGTHILELGWNDIHAAMDSRGYYNRKLTDWCFSYGIRK